MIRRGPPGAPPREKPPSPQTTIPIQGLLSMAREARKPIFHLKPADGAGGSHLKAALKAHDLFKQLALRIAGRIGVEVRA